MKPHLLYIAFWFPPSRASGVYRALATAKAFVDAGWDVTVVTADESFLTDEIGSIDRSLSDYIPEEVDVVRVPFAFDMYRSIDVRKLGRLRATFPTLWSRLFELLAPARRVRAIMRGAEPSAHSISDNYVAWIDPVVKAGLKVQAERPFDHILATGNPYSSFEAARVLSDLSSTPFSIDYRDPWTIDVFSGDPNFGDVANSSAEAAILDAATFSFHVNDAIADAYKVKHPDAASKQLVVLNGYDPDSIPAPSGPAMGGITFGMLGTLNDRWPTKPIFKAWTRVRESLPPGSRLLLAGHLGYFARSQDVLEAYLPSESTSFSYVGPVSKADVSSYYDSLDVIVLAVPGGPMVTSGKVFEAIALGKPVVCVQEEGGGARALLDGLPLSFLAEPNDASVAQAILDAAESAQSLDVETSSRAQQAATKFARANTIEAIVEPINALVSPEKRP